MKLGCTLIGAGILLVGCDSERVIGYNAVGGSDASTTLDGAVDAIAITDAGSDAVAPPQNLAASYSVSLLNGANGCAFDNFQPGNTTPGVPLTVTQAADLATGRATFGGFPAIFYSFALGSADYAIRVSGNGMEGFIIGNKTAVRDGCTVTYNASLSATVEGELIRGKVSFYSVPDRDAGCSKALCTSEQTFNGTRPPQ
jgi:hypothetical protein